MTNNSRITILFFIYTCGCMDVVQRDSKDNTVECEKMDSYFLREKQKRLKGRR